MTTPRDPRQQSLIDWGATFTPAIVAPGAEFWQIVLAEGPQDIGGNHHIYVDVLGRAGQRLVGVQVEFYWGPEGSPDHTLSMTEAKPGEAAAVNLPMYAGGNAYGVRVAEGRPSDSLFGMGLGSFVPHHSFRVVFQLATAEPVVIPPVQGLDWREALSMVRFWTDELERRLPQ